MLGVPAGDKMTNPSKGERDERDDTTTAVGT